MKLLRLVSLNELLNTVSESDFITCADGASFGSSESVFQFRLTGDYDEYEREVALLRGEIQGLVRQLCLGSAAKARVIYGRNPSWSISFPSEMGQLGQLSVLLLSLVIFSLGPANAQESCIRKMLDPDVQFQWPNSGVWVGRDLFVADTFDESLSSVRNEGFIAPPPEISSGGNPVHIRKVESRETVIVEWDNPDVVFEASYSQGELVLDRWLLIESEDVLGDRGQFSISELYDWQPLNGGLIAFADYTEMSVEGKVEYKSGFVYFTRDGIFNEIDILKDFKDPVVYQYIRNRSYIASLEDDTAALILELNEEPRLLYYDLGKNKLTKLADIPSEFGYRPVFSGGLSTGTLIARASQLKQFEESAMIHSLYSQGDDAFLLAKEAVDASTGGTNWYLINIDSTTGSELGRIKVPSSAANLLAIPGRQYWAFIERDRVSVAGPLEERKYFIPNPSLVVVSLDWGGSWSGQGFFADGAVQACSRFAETDRSWVDHF